MSCHIHLRRHFNLGNIMVENVFLAILVASCPAPPRHLFRDHGTIGISAPREALDFFGPWPPVGLSVYHHSELENHHHEWVNQPAMDHFQLCQIIRGYLVVQLARLLGWIPPIEFTTAKRYDRASMANSNMGYGSPGHSMFNLGDIPVIFQEHESQYTCCLCTWISVRKFWLQQSQVSSLVPVLPLTGSSTEHQARIVQYCNHPPYDMWPGQSFLNSQSDQSCTMFRCFAGTCLFSN